jgi:hypothetical protein
MNFIQEINKISYIITINNLQIDHFKSIIIIHILHLLLILILKYLVIFGKLTTYYILFDFYIVFKINFIGIIIPILLRLLIFLHFLSYFVSFKIRTHFDIFIKFVHYYY